MPDPASSQVKYKSLTFLGYHKYRVGDDGSIWSCHSSRRLGENALWKKLKPSFGDGRMILNLINEEGQKSFPVHILVLSAFIGPCPKGMEGCHDDGCYWNNQLENLRWDTHSENEKDKIRHKTSLWSGERHMSAKLSEDDVRQIRKLYSSGHHSMNCLCRMFGVTLGTIHPLIHHKTWSKVV